MISDRATGGRRTSIDLEDGSLRHDLEGISLLEGFPSDLMDAIVAQCTVLSLAAGETLLVAGEQNDRMFVVLSGELGVYLGESTTPVATLQRGDSAGELSVMDHGLVSATVTAIAPSRLIAIGEAMFWRVCHASHGFAMRIMLKLADRLRAINGTVQANMEMCAKLEEVAARDALTNVQSRRWLDAALPKMCEAKKTGCDALSIAVVDVDHFKRVNDQHGHLAGDAVLVEVARTLRAALRPTDFVARFGGEEFVVILPHARLGGAQIAAERLRQAVAAANMPTHDGAALPSVTVSIGVAELLDGDDANSLMERADTVLYRAKRNGRNRVES